MSNFTQDNINFTIAEYTPTKLSKRASTATYDALINNRGNKIINAVEIDWNGAELGTINDINLGTINTTGDLLNAIKALANANKYAA